ncbi:MAG: Thioredoxin reductase [Tenericutes bacterium ADurb.Bin239]|nr:MAG: Thioredoxin reductase [Tenericutes bacterium ADurb.Bin239]
MANKEIIPILIVGAGPAGMTAAIYLARANAKFKIVDKYAPGGKMNITQHVDNYPGVDTIGGPDLAFKMFEQVRGLGVSIDYAEVTKIRKETDYFVVESDEGEMYAKAVIVATGTQERKLKIPGEARYTGKGVSYCAICDGNLYKNEAIMIIGAGNSAIDEAIFVSKIVKHVHIVHRNEHFRADEASVNELKAMPNVTFHLNTIPVEVLGDGKGVTGVVVKNIADGTDKTIEVKAVFPFVGSDAVTDFLDEFDVRDEKGFVLVDEEMMTSVPGLFSIGDVNKKVLRQIVTATNDGAIAALAANRFIKRK